MGRVNMSDKNGSNILHGAYVGRTSLGVSEIKATYGILNNLSACDLQAGFPTLFRQGFNYM